MNAEFLGLDFQEEKVSLVQFSRSVVSDCLRPRESQHAGLPTITNFLSSLKLMSIESVMPSSYLTLCHPLFPLASIFQKASESFPMSQLFT